MELFGRSPATLPQCKCDDAPWVPPYSAASPNRTGSCGFRKSLFCLRLRQSFSREMRFAAVGFEPTDCPRNPLEKQDNSPITSNRCTTGCTTESGSPPSVTPDLLQLLAQLATLSDEQRALLTKLLNSLYQSNGTPNTLDDTLHHGFEEPKGETV